MKLKYYLRGLGIGIVVTAIIMSITNKPKEMTDAQIKMRALELGMVEESVLADLQAKEENGDVETVEDILNQHAKEKEEQNLEDVSAVEKQTITEVESEEVTTEDTTVAEVESEEVATEDTTVTEIEEVIEEHPVVESETEEIIIEPTEETESKENENSKTEAGIKDEVVESYTIIKVERGNGSEVVSRRLYEAGLVKSAVEYNQFLVKNGYDRKLSVGNHEIPSGATHEEMARILCGMK